MRWTSLVGLLVAGGLWLQSSAAEAQDLTVSSFTTQVTGTSVTFTATVCNNGASIPDTFTVDLYFNRVTGPVCGNLGERWDFVDGLATGACTTLTFTRGSTPAGTYTAWVRADSTCDITETSEANNNASASYSVGTLPDLSVTSFTTAVTGSTVTFTVNVCNQGAQEATDFWVDVYYNQTTAPGCSVVGNNMHHIDSLAAGSCRTETFTRTSTPAGSYQSWARVDTLCEVAESNENDNNATANYSVGSTLPDLTVTTFTSSVSLGTVTFSAVVCNNGGVAAPSFDVDLYYSSATAPSCGTLGNLYYTVPSLAAGACTTLPFTRAGTPSGTYTAWVRADSKCIISESNEGNNNASSAYTITALADLRMAAFTSSVSGSTVTFSTTICNNGSTTATGFRLDLYYHRATAPGCDVVGDDTVGIPSLAAGACATLAFTRTGTANGTYLGWASVDSFCDVTESSESNNTASSAYTVGTVPPDLTVSLTTSVAGSTTTFNANVCNNGGATSSAFRLDVYYNRVGAPACPTLGDDFVSIASLAAGACTTRAFTQTSAPTGSYVGWVRVDSGCVITESNENNNNASSSYTIGALPDLMIQSFTAVPSGTAVTFTVNVCNSAGPTVTNVNLEIYYSLTAAPGCATTHSQQATIASLAAGACTTRSFTRAATPAGSYTGWARVDADCAIAESNENNNNAQATYVVILPVDQGVPPDKSKPDTSKIDGAKHDLLKADLRKTDLTRADLTRADLAKVDLARADLAKRDATAPQADQGVPATDATPEIDSRPADGPKLRADKATGKNISSDGCSCEVASPDARPGTLLLVALLGLSLLVNRRRRRRR